MNTTAKIIIGALAAVVIALSVGLVVVTASDDDGDDSGASYWNVGIGPYNGMMGAMGQGNWDQMQDYMRQVLGEDGYQQMLEHTETDGCQWSAGNGSIDGFMHDMMYGIMYRGLNNGATPAPGMACW